MLFRERRLVLISFAGTLLAVALYALFAPSYQAHMKVLVRRGRMDPLMTATPSQSGPIERMEVTEEELNSEVELLGDDEILRPVVQNSGLADEKSWLEQLLNQDEQEHLAHAVRRIQRKLEVKPIHKSNLIAVTYSSSDPERAAAVLRCLANAYLERHQRVRRPSGEFRFFEQQVEQARSGLLGAEVRLMDFNSERSVVAAALERDTILQKLTDTEADEGQTRVAIHETVQRIRELEAKLKSLPERATTLVRRLDNPQLMEKMKSKLLELELKRTELLTKFEPSYRLVQEVDQQIAETGSTLATEDEKPLRDETTDQAPDHAWARAELVKAQVGLVTLEARAAGNNPCWPTTAWQASGWGMTPSSKKSCRVI